MRLRNILMLVFAGVFSGLSSQLFSQVKVTDGTVLTMDPNSLLELESTNKGLLIPRITLTSLILPAPLSAPVPEGMLIYNTGGSIANWFLFLERDSMDTLCNRNREPMDNKWY